VDYAATGSDAVDMELLEHLPQDAIPQYKNLIARAPATQHERGALPALDHSNAAVAGMMLPGQHGCYGSEPPRAE